MAKKEEKETNYETNSYWSYRDISAGVYFNILNDFEMKDLVRIIQEPMLYNKELRIISRRLYSSSGILRNTLDYMQALPTLDYVLTSYTNDGKSKLNKEIVNYTLKTINHKDFVRDVLLKGMIDGIAFYYFNTAVPKDNRQKFMSKWVADEITEINSLKPRLAKLKANIISLPVDYTEIVGRKNNHYCLAFDLSYFDRDNVNPEIELRMFPSEFTDAYNKWKKSGKSANQMFLLDDSKTLVHKISSNLSEKWGRVLCLAAIVDILYSDKFRNAKSGILDNVNNQIIYETFPEGSAGKGSSALSQKQQQDQHNAIKSVVQTRKERNGVSFFSVAAGTKIDSIDVKTDLFDNDYESNLDTKVGTALGFAASLLNASGTTSFSSQQTNLDLVSSQIFAWIESITEELNKVINYNVLGLDYNDIEIYYLPITRLNREKVFSTAKDLYQIGRGSLSYLATCAGLPKQVFFAMLDEQLEEKIMEKYPINATSFNTAGGDTTDEESKAGRPTEENPTNENTIRSKTNNSNDIPKPQ